MTKSRKKTLGDVLSNSVIQGRIDPNRCNKKYRACFGNDLKCQRFKNHEGNHGIPSEYRYKDEQLLIKNESDSND